LELPFPDVSLLSFLQQVTDENRITKILVFSLFNIGNFITKSIYFYLNGILILR
jgi:hypothetical protein